MMHAEPSGSACQSIDSLIEKLQNGVEVLRLSGHEQLNLTHKFCYHSVCRYSVVGFNACRSVLTKETCPQVDGMLVFCFISNVALLQLQEKVKDVHMSEIIDVYEQKLSALAVSNQARKELPVCTCNICRLCIHVLFYM